MSEGRVTKILTAADATQESVMHYATLRPDENIEDAVELGLAPMETGAAEEEGHA
jgi:ribose transport system ATP-binding protein